MSFVKGLCARVSIGIFFNETSKQILLTLKNNSIHIKDLHTNVAHVKKTNIGKGGSLNQEHQGSNINIIFYELTVFLALL